MQLTTSSRPKLQRNLRRRRLGGVCAGVADYLGTSVKWVRLGVLVSVFFSFSLTLWIYLALWLFLPARAEVPIPPVSRNLRRELQRIGRLVRKAHRRLDPQVADQAQSAFDDLKLLAAGIEKRDSLPANVRSVWTSARSGLPRLLQQLLALPETTGFQEARPYERLAGELERLQKALREASIEAIDSEITDELGTQTHDSAEVTAWRNQLEPLHERLRERAGQDTLTTLQRIEEKLAFLIEHSDSRAEPFDFKPFEVHKIAFDYLPDTINNYLQLPSQLAQSERLRDGRTAEQALQEQLHLLDHALADLTRSYFDRDAESLLIHGRFIKDKFARQPFL
ncbi:MAG: PspC domain-containing protein [Pseudomonadota bacterium]|nr:PspC domain-containing protein [Pseudomonadota bacterium]